MHEARAAKIPATVVTGFLGAGKTTLVRHLLANAGGRRIAVIVNEFGALGIDGELLRACGIEGCDDEDIVELANGCLCCTVAEDFLPAMQALLDRPLPPEHIVIETSGLALPKPLLKAFNWPAIRSRVTVDGVVAVVDAPAVAAGRFADDPEAVARQRAADPSLDHDNPLAEVYEDQLQAADLIVLNKADLLDADAMARLREQVAAAAPRAVKVVPASEGRLDPAVLLGLDAAAEDDLDCAAVPSRRGGRRARARRFRELRRPAAGDRRAGCVARRAARGRRAARRAAHEGLRRGARQADAPARPGRRRALPPGVRPSLAPGRGARAAASW